MKMKHVMAALLFGVVALSTAQAEEEKHYRYYPYSMEALYTGILASKDLNKGCEIGLDNYNKYVLNKQNDEGAGAKYKKPWTDYTRNDHPHRQIMCSYKRHSYLGNGKWSPWVDAQYVLTGITCYDGGRFLWRDKNLCAEEVDKKDVVVCDPSFHEDGKVPEGCPPLPPPKNPCDPSYYPNGIVPEDCPKNKPEIDPVTGYPKNDALCDGKDYGEDAGVACHGGIRKPCFWAKREDLEKAFPNKIARDINYQCVMEHEQFHADDHQGAICKENGRLGGITEYHQHRREADAYVKSEECFRRERTQCGDDPVCKKIIEGIEGRINHSKSWKDFHNNAIGR